MTKENTEEIEEVEVVITDRKCPNCGGTLKFDPKEEGLLCGYCGFKKKLPHPEDESVLEEIDFRSEINRASTDWGVMTRQYMCKQCGAVTVHDAMQISGCCAFCGSTIVIDQAAEAGTIAPNAVIPFKITKEQAEQKANEWLSKKILASKDIKRGGKVPPLQGVYIPYWTFDADTTTTYSGKFGYRHGSGDNSYTTWKRKKAVYTKFFNDKVVCGSRRCVENRYIKNAAEYFDGDMIPYTADALAGFMAERYSVGLDEAWSINREQIRKELNKDIVFWHEKAAEVKNFKMSTVYDNITYKYYLAPFWITSFMYKDKLQQIVVNGSTGKVSGNWTIAPWKLVLIIGIILLVIFGPFILTFAYAVISAWMG